MVRFLYIIHFLFEFGVYIVFSTKFSYDRKVLTKTIDSKSGTHHARTFDSHSKFNFFYSDLLIFHKHCKFHKQSWKSARFK